MIPVIKQIEPEKFDNKVRQPGLKWLSNNSNVIPSNNKGSYWTLCKDDIYYAYQGICAYYSYFIEKSSGAVTIDHFQPKSKYPDMAYEWTNFRLACLQANRNKSNYEDVLDPFLLKQNTFCINFSDGSIFINPECEPSTKILAESTIHRLKLNAKDLCDKRANDFSDYIEGQILLRYLEERSPFVWYEIKRQNLDKL